MTTLESGKHPVVKILLHNATRNTTVVSLNKKTRKFKNNYIEYLAISNIGIYLLTVMHKLFARKHPTSPRVHYSEGSLVRRVRVRVRVRVGG